MVVLTFRTVQRSEIRSIFCIQEKLNIRNARFHIRINSASFLYRALLNEGQAIENRSFTKKFKMICRCSKFSGTTRSTGKKNILQQCDKIFLLRTQLGMLGF